MTDETLIILLAFILGWLAGLTFPNSPIYYEIKWWLLDHTPLRCPRCKTWHARRDMVSARHNVAGWVRICEHCHNELYHPTQRS